MKIVNTFNTLFMKINEIIPDEEEELIYHFQRKAKIRNAKGAKNLAYILLFYLS